MDASLNEAALLPVLRDGMAVNFGDYGLGMALASLSVKYYNPLTGLSVVRCSRDQCKEVCHLSFLKQCDQNHNTEMDIISGQMASQVLACLTTVTSIRHRTVLIRLLHNGGTLSSCQRAAMQHDAAALKHLRLTAAQQGMVAERQQKLHSMEL